MDNRALTHSTNDFDGLDEKIVYINDLMRPLGRIVCVWVEGQPVFPSSATGVPCAYRGEGPGGRSVIVMSDTP